MTQIQQAAEAAISGEDLQEVAQAFRTLTHAIHALMAALGEDDLANATPSAPATPNLVEDIHQDILRCYGPVMRGRDLAHLLGYTPAQYRAAVRRGESPIPVSHLPGRRGYQATAQDIAAWLAALRERALSEMQ